MRTQKALYEYALIAGVVYADHPTNNCFVEATQQHIEIPKHKLVPLLAEDVDYRWKPQILERWTSDHIPRPDNLGRYIGDDGVTYLTCTYDNVLPQIALTWKELWQTLDNNEDMPVPIGLYLELLAVLPRAFLPPNEELGIIQLKRDPSSSNEPEDLVAIRGTDFTRIPQIMASLYHLLNGSCVYEMAAIVVSVVGSEPSTGHFSVVGHSLGGGAAQYIVHDHAKHQWRQNTNVNFSAYSFNSIGIEPLVENTAPLSLYSYIVAGDVVSWLGEMLAQSQVGIVIRFVPPETWHPTGWLKVIDDVLQVEFVESLRRHQLHAVQSGLCECMNGKGSVVLRP